MLFLNEHFDHSGFATAVAVFENVIFKRSGFVTAVAVFENAIFSHSGFATAVAVFENAVFERSGFVTAAAVFENAIFNHSGFATVPLGPPRGRLGVPLGGCGESFWVALGCLWDLLGRLEVPLGAPGGAGGQFRPPWRGHVAEVLCLSAKTGLPGTRKMVNTVKTIILK